MPVTRPRRRPAVCIGCADEGSASTAGGAGI